tara:strand:+ start:1110 stop:1637 length:528 start_codon:yes stop_codon:yes gene_type:complete
MGTLNLGTGAQFVGGANGLTDAPTGSIIQTAINGSTSDITVNSDGSYTDIISINFTPRQSNSRLIYTLMFNSYTHNGSSGTSNGTSYQVLRDSTQIKEAVWCFYLNHSSYPHDFYPTTMIQDFDEPGTTSAITYKLQGRKYSGSSGSFATRFGEPQRSGSAKGNSIVFKIEELAQ